MALGAVVIAVFYPDKDGEVAGFARYNKEDEAASSTTTTRSA